MGCWLKPSGNGLPSLTVAWVQSDVEAPVDTYQAIISGLRRSNPLQIAANLGSIDRQLPPTIPYPSAHDAHQINSVRYRATNYDSISTRPGRSKRSLRWQAASSTVRNVSNGTYSTLYLTFVLYSYHGFWRRLGLQRVREIAPPHPLLTLAYQSLARKSCD